MKFNDLQKLATGAFLFVQGPLNMEYIGYHNHRWTDNSNESKVKEETLNKAKTKTMETKTSFDEVNQTLFSI